MFHRVVSYMHESAWSGGGGGVPEDYGAPATVLEIADFRLHARGLAGSSGFALFVPTGGGLTPFQYSSVICSPPWAGLGMRRWRLASTTKSSTSSGT